MTEVMQKLSGNRIESVGTKFPTPPAMRLEEYFLGTTNAIGIFQDRFGKLRRQFSAVMTGCVEGDTLHLHEKLAYDDGELETRTWRVKKLGENGYEGTCENVVGTARGRVLDNVFNWQYDFQLKIGGRKLTVRFDDTMYLQAGGVVINRVRMSKFGVTLGTATIIFFRDPAELAELFGSGTELPEALKAAAE